jgi:hypothetical protein
MYSGDWAGNVWSGSGVPGQEQSCATRTGVASCSDYVLNNGGAFKEACESLKEAVNVRNSSLRTDWEVAYVKLYQIPS